VAPAKARAEAAAGSDKMPRLIEAGGGKRIIEAGGGKRKEPARREEATSRIAPKEAIGQYEEEREVLVDETPTVVESVEAITEETPTVVEPEVASPVVEAPAEDAAAEATAADTVEADEAVSSGDVEEGGE